MPVGNEADLYGSGYVNGTIIGIPKGGEEPGRGLGAPQVPDDRHDALASLSIGLRNVPSTRAALKSTELEPDPKFAAFMTIFVNPKSATLPVTPLGSANQEAFTSFLAKWQAGK